MKLRIPVAILLVASLGLAACGGDSDEDNAEKAFADAVEQAQDDLDNARDEADQAADDQAADEDDKAADGTADDKDANTDDSDTSIPDLDNLGDCMEISFAYAGLALASLGGSFGGEELSDADVAELKDQIEELQKGLPKDVQDDFDVVAKAYNTAIEKGFTNKDAQKAFESDEFTKASEGVQAYIDELCA